MHHVNYCLLRVIFQILMAQERYFSTIRLGGIESSSHKSGSLFGCDGVSALYDESECRVIFEGTLISNEYRDSISRLACRVRSSAFVYRHFDFSVD